MRLRPRHSSSWAGLLWIDVGNGRQMYQCNVTCNMCEMSMQVGKQDWLSILSHKKKLLLNPRWRHTWTLAYSIVGTFIREDAEHHGLHSRLLECSWTTADYSREASAWNSYAFVFPVCIIRNVYLQYLWSQHKCEVNAGSFFLYPQKMHEWNISRNVSEMFVWFMFL